MNNFYKNKIIFKLEKPRKTKDLIVIPFAEIKDIPDKAGFKFLQKDLKEFFKKSLVKLSNIDAEIFHSHYGDVFLVKYNKTLNLRQFVISTRKIFKILKEKKIKNFSIFLEDLPQIEKWEVSVENEKEGYEIEYRKEIIPLEKLTEIFVSNCILADFDFGRFYKKPPKEGWSEIKEITLHARSGQAANFKKAVGAGILIGEETNRARFLSNLPGGDLTPSKFVEFAKNVSKESNLNIKILGEEELKKLGAGGILGVSRGSKEKPYLVILESGNRRQERKNKKSQRPETRNPKICLIGKGITFDTGGLHIKHSDGMSEMHMDMSGAASVLSAMSLISKLSITTADIMAVIPVCENMPSGESFRPGDILKTISGKTIEVGSPDAEGRIILADAIDYAKKFYKPDLIVELSTLTGASEIALGTKASAIFTSKEKLEPILKNIGEMSGDYVWPLPLWDEYKEDIKSNFADISNIGKSRYGGAIHGAMFLEEFAKPTAFIHIDIAPKMTTIPEEFLSKGAGGFGVRYLKELTENVKSISNTLKN